MRRRLIKKAFQISQTLFIGDFNNAYYLFNQLAENKIIPGMYYKAVMLLDGLGVSPNFEDGVTMLEQVYNCVSQNGPDENVDYLSLTCYQLGNANCRINNLSKAVDWWQNGAQLLESPLSKSSEMTFNVQPLTSVPDRSIRN